MAKIDTPMLGERAQRALNMAFDVHRNQVRKSRGGQIPYFSHLSTVAGMVLELNGTEDEFIAAILHDSVEDQSANVVTWLSINAAQGHTVSLSPTAALEEIEKEFGTGVSDIIKQLTDPKLPKEFKSLPRDKRLPFIKEQREKKFEKLRTASDSVRKIKACDALHNLRSLYQDYTETGPDVFKNFVADQEGTIWYYEKLAEIFNEYGPRRAGIEMEIMLSRLKAKIAAEKNL